MGEKRGETVKLSYDFNTAGVLEVYLKERWCRTTAREFRSFDGQRRITEPTKAELGNVLVPMVTYEYEGPVYMFATNKEANKRGIGEIVNSIHWEDSRKATEKRGV